MLQGNQCYPGMASPRPAQRRFIEKSGRRDSNPRQPAWEAGGRKITACLTQTAFTGCLKGASSFSRTHEKSCHMHFSRILAKVVALPGRQVVMRFCTHQHYTLLLEKRQNAVRTLFAHWIYERMCGVASTGANLQLSSVLFSGPIPISPVT
jgi:hypothetical protein